MKQKKIESFSLKKIQSNHLNKVLDLRLCYWNVEQYFILALAAESELKKFGQFVDDYSDKLRSGLQHSAAFSSESQILPGLKKDNVLAMTSVAFEGVSLPSLVHNSTDNLMLGKVILALSAIGSEIDFLISEDELKKKFLDPILLYGAEASGKIYSFLFFDNW